MTTGKVCDYVLLSVVLHTYLSHYSILSLKISELVVELVTFISLSFLKK